MRDVSPVDNQIDRLLASEGSNLNSQIQSLPVVLPLNDRRPKWAAYPRLERGFFRFRGGRVSNYISGQIV